MEIPTFLVDGQNPPMDLLRRYLARLSGQAASALLNSADGATPFATLALAQAAASVDPGTQARVYNDPDATKNGLYVNPTGNTGGYVLDQAFYGAVGQAFQPLIERARAATITVQTFADREAIPLDERPYGLTIYVEEGMRDFRWTQGGGDDPDQWVGLYTQAELKNLGIDFTGQLPAANVEGLPDAQGAIDDLAAVRIAGFRAAALSGDATPKVELAWEVKGNPTGQVLSWGTSSIAIAAAARSFTPKDWAANKPIFVAGNSLSTSTDTTNRWSQLLAADRNQPLYSTARYTSDWNQVYRTGAAPLYLTIAGGSLPAGGTSASVTLINGAAPTASSSGNPASFLNTGDAGLTTGVTMTGTVIAGAVARHVTVSIPNAASTAYSIVQDAGGTAVPLDGPVLFVPDIAKQITSSDLILWTGNNYFYSGVGNQYGDYTNPQMWVDMGKIVAAAEGNRVLILPVLPSADDPVDGAPNPYVPGENYHIRAARVAANARTEALFPTAIARDAQNRALLKRLQDSGNGSAGDNADIAAGFVPRSLRVDALHLNAAGDAVVFAFVKEALARQPLPAAVTQDTAFTLNVSGANPRTMEAVQDVAFAVVKPSEFAALVDPLRDAVGAVAQDAVYRPTIAAAIADFEVGTFFTSRDLDGVTPNAGIKWQYKVTATPPYYSDEGRWADTDAATLGLEAYVGTTPESLPPSNPTVDAISGSTGALAQLTEYALTRRIRTDAAQALSEGERSTARGNIDAVSGSDLAAPGDGRGANLIGYRVNLPMADRLDSIEMPWDSVDKAVNEDNWTKALATGRPIRAKRRQNYAFANDVKGVTSCPVDFNGSTIIPDKKGFTLRKTKFSYTGGAYFTSTRGAASFPLPAGLLIQRGDMLRLESDEINVSAGTYKHGQYARVSRVDGSTTPATVILTGPFYASYRVDRIYVMEPAVFILRNGRIDLSGAAAVASADNGIVGAEMIGAMVGVQDMEIIGPEAGSIGIYAEGMTVRVRDSYATGFLEKYGIPNNGGRRGYGFQVGGDDVLVSATSGDRCKHFVSAAAGRHYVSRTIRLENCQGYNPPFGAAVVTPDGAPISQPLYQWLIDCHANCEYLYIDKPELEGPNGLIAVRNGWAEVTSPRLRQSEVNYSYANDGAIYVGEAPVRRLNVTNVDWEVDATYQASGIASLIAVNVFDASVNGPISINGANVKGGRLFRVVHNGNAGGFESVEARGIRGELSQGIQIVGASAAAPLGPVGKVVLEGQIRQSATYGPIAPLVDVHYAASLREWAFLGQHDCKAAGGTGFAARIGIGDDNIIMPQLTDMRGLILDANQGAIALQTLSTVPIGVGLLDGARISHNNSGVTTDFSPGVYASLPSQPSKAWTHRGAVITSGAPGQASSENIRFSNRSLLDLTGLTINDAVNLGVDTSPAAQASLVGYNKPGTVWLPFRGSPPVLWIDPAGRLGADTTPTTAALAAGTVVYMRSPVKGGVAAWTYVAGQGWIATAWITVFATAAPATAPIAIGSEWVDTTNGKAYRATGTSAASDWKLLN